MSRSHLPVVKMLITSQEEAVISESLKGLPRLRVSAENISRDIVSYVEGTVKWNIPSGALIIQDLSLESDIISTLVDGAQGMWVSSSHYSFVKLHGLMLSGSYGFIFSLLIFVKPHQISVSEKPFETFQRV